MTKSLEAQYKEAAQKYAERNKSDPHAYGRMLTHLRNGVENLGKVKESLHMK